MRPASWWLRREPGCHEPNNNTFATVLLLPLQGYSRQGFAYCIFQPALTVQVDAVQARLLSTPGTQFLKLLHCLWCRGTAQDIIPCRQDTHNSWVVFY